MRNPDVDEWFANYDNPRKDVLLYMREAILGSDERIEESIKWKSPTFSYKGNIASFDPRSKQHASLMFHTGCEHPGGVPAPEGTGDEARYLKVADLAQAKELEPELLSVFKAWCDMKDADDQA